MKLSSPWSLPSKFLFGMALKCRRLLPKIKCHAFGDRLAIEHIYVINLKRQPDRFVEIKRELSRLLDMSGVELWNRTERFSAIDAADFLQNPARDTDVDPNYTLGDQLFVEPQPLALPTKMDLDSTIQMSRPEIAVARSHIEVWRQVLKGCHEYALVLEDDVWFRSGFAKELDLAWAEIMNETNTTESFDILYLSYQEVKHGAPKSFLSGNIFRPLRGLWHLSGYVVSRKGAQKLLQLLPCRGPIDLWINHQFRFLDVRAIKRSVISQRPDFGTTNSYSILPSLTKIGAITSEGAALFQVRPTERPVFVFGPNDSGLTSIAMALSMLGYRCCSDIETLPDAELEMLFAGKTNRVFDAYVNIGSLALEAQMLKERYPQAKFILTGNNDLKIIENLNTADITVIHAEASNKWQLVCEHLRCAPPGCSFPELTDRGQRSIIGQKNNSETELDSEVSKRDDSPWVVELQHPWKGIQCVVKELSATITATSIKINDCFEFIDQENWLLRNDTFTDNLALFRPSNIELISGHGAALNVKRESLGVREYSAASLTSREKFMYGRFEAILKVSNVPGVVTGFFLHRDSPRQEIDIEIAGNRTDRLLVNVFYNPGGEGAKFDYGYRGAASYIDLGFDASETFHLYAIEWGPCEIRWFVDNLLVHRRFEWDPTPIPHLPMSLHVNLWPCRSRELAGRLTHHRLAATTFIKSIVLESGQPKKSTSV